MKIFKDFWCFIKKGRGYLYAFLMVETLFMDPRITYRFPFNINSHSSPTKPLILKFNNSLKHCLLTRIKDFMLKYVLLIHKFVLFITSIFTTLNKI